MTGALPTLDQGQDSRVAALDAATPVDWQKRVLVLTSALFLILLFLAAIVPISGAVIATGRVTSSQMVQRVAHTSGGIVEQVFVQNGTRVAKGQLLIKLSDDETSMASDQASLSVQQLLARKARLEAERANASAIKYPKTLLDQDTQGAIAAMRDEDQIFWLRRTEMEQKRRALQAQLAQIRYRIDGLKSQLIALEKQRELISPELANVRSLWARKLVTINRLNELERQSAALDGSISAMRSEIAQAGAQTREVAQQLDQIGVSGRAEAAAELSRTNAALGEQQTRSGSFQLAQDRKEIRAPIAGIVEKLSVRGPGQVVRASDPILEVVPDRGPMIVEAVVPPAEISAIRVGMASRVRFPTLRERSTPDIAGSVSYVAADPETDQATGKSFFALHVAVDWPRSPGGAQIPRNGLPAEVFIQTGDRTLLALLTKPLRDQIMRAFRRD